MARSSVASSPPESSEPERPPPRLVLASEALREDVAPRHPGARRGRLALLGTGAAFGLVAGAAHARVPLFGSQVGAVSAAACLSTVALAALPLRYTARAVAASVLGAALLVLGMLGVGPAGALADSAAGSQALPRALALGLLPGALLFRAQYRAYRRARGILALAVLLAVPFLVEQVGLVVDGSTPFLTRGGALLDVAAVLSGLFGFMGEDTTAGGSVWACLVLLVLPADIALAALDRAHHHAHGSVAFTHGLLAQVAGALGTLGVATVLAVGAYHGLSALFGADARRAAKARAREESAGKSVPPKSPA
ncbi:MAG TPA: hypothetical protein VHE30_13285 [Polyangiaceae bacterium]|nr:hypothetical protein [Polyangiaceae bacterium]